MAADGGQFALSFKYSSMLCCGQRRHIYALLTAFHTHFGKMEQKVVVIATTRHTFRNRTEPHDGTKSERESGLKPTFLQQPQEMSLFGSGLELWVVMFTAK